MKTLIICLMLLIAVPGFATEKLPFAPKGKYGKLRTKQAKFVGKKSNLKFGPKCKKGKLRTKKLSLVRKDEAWIQIQWGRN